MISECYSKNGYAIRHSKARERPINIESRIQGEPPLAKQYGCFNRVRAIQRDVKPRIRATDLFLIIILGHSVDDDDEYLVDIECLPERNSTSPNSCMENAANSRIDRKYNYRNS